MRVFLPQLEKLYIVKRIVFGKNILREHDFPLRGSCHEVTDEVEKTT